MKKLILGLIVIFASFAGIVLDAQKELVAVDARFPVVQSRTLENGTRLELRKDLLNFNTCIADRYDRDGVLVNSFTVHPGSCI